MGYLIANRKGSPGTGRDLKAHRPCGKKVETGGVGAGDAAGKIKRPAAAFDERLDFRLASEYEFKTYRNDASPIYVIALVIYTNRRSGGGDQKSRLRNQR